MRSRSDALSGTVDLFVLQPDCNLLWWFRMVRVADGIIRKSKRQVLNGRPRMSVECGRRRRGSVSQGESEEVEWKGGETTIWRNMRAR